MNSSAKATRVHFDQNSMWVDLSDGRILAVPLAWFPRLLHATAEQRERLRISSRGLHWEALDEDISIAGLLAGEGDLTQSQKTFAARMGYDFSQGKRGRIAAPEPEPPGKTRITIRLDEGLVDHFLREADASGGATGYRTLINEALRQHLECKRQNRKRRFAAS